MRIITNIPTHPQTDDHLQQSLQMEESQNRLYEMERERDGILFGFNALQDELEIYKPMAEKLDQEQAKYDRARAKLEEISDLKHQLMEEQKNHNSNYSKLVQSEKQVNLSAEQNN